jgi:hypothetical protein
MEMGLSLLAQSHLPTEFWVDAFSLFAYIINRLPTPILSNESPFFKLYHQQPDYSLLRVFRCACYPVLRPYTPHKLVFKSKQCIFLGFSSNHKGYRCFDLVSRKVYLSRNVVFDESLFPAIHRSLSPAPSRDVLPAESSLTVTVPETLTRPAHLSHNMPPSPNTPATTIQEPPHLPMVPTLPHPCPISDHLIASPTPTSRDAHNPSDIHTSPLAIPMVPTLPHSCPPSDHIIASPPHSSYDAQDPCDSHNSPLVIPFPHLVAPSRVENDIPNSLPTASACPLQVSVSGSIPRVNESAYQPHQMVTRSQAGSLKPKQFGDYQIFYFSKQPLQALYTTVSVQEPLCFSEAFKSSD